MTFSPLRVRPCNSIREHTQNVNVNLYIQLKSGHITLATHKNAFDQNQSTSYRTLCGKTSSSTSSSSSKKNEIITVCKCGFCSMTPRHNFVYIYTFCDFLWNVFFLFSSFPLPPSSLPFYYSYSFARRHRLTIRCYCYLNLFTYLCFAFHVISFPFLLWIDCVCVIFSSYLLSARVPRNKFPMRRKEQTLADLHK